MPNLFRDPHLLPWNTVASYLLIPSHDATGKISPVMAAGWTLCFEMAFYYACTACLALKRRPEVWLTPVFVVLGFIGLFRTTAWGAPATLIDPLLLEFVGGMWIADFTRRGIFRSSWRSMGALLALGLLLLLSSTFLDPQLARNWRVAVWGLPAVMIVYAMIGLEDHCAFGKLRLPLLLGDASYSIYLAHVLVIGAVIGLVRKFVLPVGGTGSMYVVLTVAGVGGGVVVWQLVERKIILGLRNVSRRHHKALIHPRQELEELIRSTLL
jgi:exopolysaccharide production protein ExoZ